MKQKALFILALFFVLFSCSKDKDNGKEDDGEDPGYATEFTETCNPLSYPGLEISIDGDVSSEIDYQSELFNDYMECVQECSETDFSDPNCIMDCISLLGIVPIGGAFSLTFYITNTTESEITYIVEPGDWFEPGDSDYQPMMCPINIIAVISPGETKTMIIPVYCLASSKSAPDAISEYTMCEAVAANGCLKDIVDILATKDLATLTFVQTMEIQQIIWNCTEDEEVDWDYLNNLPDL